MISCKLEQVGDRFALMLEAGDAERLNVKVGETLQLEIAGDGSAHLVERESWVEDTHARGRAFLKRYRRAFDRLS